MRFFANFVRQFADIGLIVGSIMGAVSFTLVLLTGNAMAQAVRERLSEIAVLKTIGFTDRSVLALILSESVVLLVLGGAVGLACAAVGISVARAKLGPSAHADCCGKYLAGWTFVACCLRGAPRGRAYLHGAACVCGSLMRWLGTDDVCVATGVVCELCRDGNHSAATRPCAVGIVGHCGRW